MVATGIFQQVFPRPEMYTGRLVLEFSSAELASQIVLAAPYLAEMPIPFSAKASGPFVQFAADFRQGEGFSTLVTWAHHYVSERNTQREERIGQLKREIRGRDAFPLPGHTEYVAALVREYRQATAARPAWVEVRQGFTATPNQEVPRAFLARAHQKSRVFGIVSAGLAGGFFLGWLPLTIAEWWRRERALRAPPTELLAQPAQQARGERPAVPGADAFRL